LFFVCLLWMERLSATAAKELIFWTKKAYTV
jgi:hypothetical protein